MSKPSYGHSRILVTLPDVLLSEMEALSRTTGDSKSEIIKHAVRHYIPAFREGRIRILGEE